MENSRNTLNIRYFSAKGESKEHSFLMLYDVRVQYSFRLDLQTRIYCSAFNLLTVLFEQAYRTVVFSQDTGACAFASQFTQHYFIKAPSMKLRSCQAVELWGCI